MNTAITIARGDGIGPEIMEVTLRVLKAAQARLDIEEIEIGEKVYQRGIHSGIEPSAWESLRRTKVFLKAPITTPQGGGYKSLNVTVRKTLGLYANVRPCVSYAPYVKTLHPDMNVVVVRENEEDTYAGMEHQQTDEVTQCLKLISRPGSDRIIRYAFEYARLNSRKKVTCMVKDNIMKISDGLFAKRFFEIAKEYPDIEHERIIIDIGMARVADQPELFDVIVTLNLYGDILSDVTAQIAGSVGLAGSANVGKACAMFEAIHGSAPTIAGKNIANPSALLMGAVMMLVHIGQSDVAEKVHNAVLCTIEEGIHTEDIYSEKTSQALVGTKAFGEAVIERLGKKPKHLKAAHYKSGARMNLPEPELTVPAHKELVGVDVFFHWNDAGRSANALGKLAESLNTGALKLSVISNRGVKVYPDGLPETFCSDHWRCRYLGRQGPITHKDILELLSNAQKQGLDFIKTEHLYTFDGIPAYAADQGA